MSPESANRHPRQPRRPLLGGGEKLSTDTTWGRMPGKSDPVYTAAEMHLRLSPQAQALRSEFAGLPADLRVPHLVFEATLWPNYLASSHYPAAVLEECGLYQVGARQAKADYRTATRERADQPTKTLLLAGDDDAVQHFLNLIETPPTSEESPAWRELREFARLGVGSNSTVIRSLPADFGEGELFTWEAVLTLVGRTERERASFADEAFRKFRNLVARLQGDVDVEYRREVGGLLFVPVSLTVESVQRAPAFNLLRVIRPMPALRSIDDMYRPSKRRPPSAPPRGTKPVSGSPIAVIDGGVDLACAALTPFVRQFDLTPEAADPLFVTHGTIVTAAALYGYIDAGTALPPPIAPVDHYRVLPPPGVEAFDDRAYWLLDKVLEAVKGKGYTLVNLSLGPDLHVDPDGEPDRWTVTLDTLAAEEGLSIVCAAGNNGDDEPNSIMVPADIVNGVAVGACSGRSGLPRRARYSAVGPGRFGQRVSPTGVSFGGAEKDPFVGLAPGGILRETQGTSFAVPLVTHGLAELEALLGPHRAAPHALRAFAAHFAERRATHHRSAHLGHGRLPESYVDLWECRPDEVSVLYQAEFRRGGKTAMYLPLLEGLPESVPVDVRWTLCYQTQVEPKSASDYTRCGFEIYFRPHFNLRSLYDDATKESIGVFDIVKQANEIVKLSRDRAVKWSDTPVAGKGRRFQTENALRDAGKWETLSQGRQQLLSGELHRPRIDLNYLHRSDGVLVGEDVKPMALSLLVTVRAHGIDGYYDRARQAFQSLVPLLQHVEVPVRLAG